MLIDDFLPTYDVASRHEITIHAPVARVFAVARSFDPSKSRVIRWLFRLRGLPTTHCTLDDLQKIGFIPLAEAQESELLLGLIGQFWRFSGNLQQMPPDDFRRFNRPGYAKAIWNFSCEKLGDAATLLVTETRVQCADDISRRRFRRYWLFIRPFSGWIRNEMLRLVKKVAEGEQQAMRPEALHAGESGFAF